MNRSIVKKQTGSPDFGGILILMLVCLVALVLGNLLFHARALPQTNDGSLRLWSLFSFEPSSVHSPVDFLLSVIGASRGDVLCVILISVAYLIKIPRLFISSVLAYRSFLFGFCGAYIISAIGSQISFFQGCVTWGLFFVYHISFFAILICFSSSIFASLRDGWSAARIVNYLLIICGEISLVLLLNVIYYFLISKL